MNPDTPREARELFRRVRIVAGRSRRATVIVCPPAIFLPLLKSGLNLALGGQDASAWPRGAVTGSISAAELKYSGAEYVMIGHSERRRAGETDELINQKIKLALKTGLRVIFCVGENTRDDHGDYLQVLRSMLERGLEQVSRAEAGRLIVAYEPVWAIGGATNQADTPEGFLEQSLFIKKILAGRFGSTLAWTIPILYGGSVSPDNAGSFLAAGEAAGLLIGHESLRADHFNSIIRLADETPWTKHR